MFTSLNTPGPWIADVEFVEQGHRVQNQLPLRAWLEAYSAATTTTAYCNAILEQRLLETIECPGQDSSPPVQVNNGYSLFRLAEASMTNYAARLGTALSTFTGRSSNSVGSRSSGHKAFT